MLVMCERWVGDGDRLLHIDQSSSGHSSTSSTFWLGCSTVSHWGPQALSLQTDSHAGILSPTDSNCNWNSNWLELTRTVCGTWLYFCLTSTSFLWAYASEPNSTTSTSQGDIPISSTGYTCFAALLLTYTGAPLDWRLGRGSICYIYCNHSFQEPRCSVVAKVQDCDVIVSEFELQSRSRVQFSTNTLWKDVNPLSTPSNVLNRTTTPTTVLLQGCPWL